MSQYLQAFNASADLVRAEYGNSIQWRFGAPATPEVLAKLEQHLGMPMPQCLRELLSEANGIQVLDPTWGKEWNPLYFSVEQMMTDVVTYLETSGNPMPPADELRSVAFFSHQNGFAYLNGICLTAFSEFEAGDIVYLEHDSGEFSKIADTLEEFMADQVNCRL